MSEYLLPTPVIVGGSVVVVVFIDALFTAESLVSKNLK
jgi:hypothetical protein